MSNIRIGHGFDVHAFGDGDHVMIGGVRVPHGRGVVAHSDGDVAIHALCDAMLGALKAGLGADWANTLVVVATEFGRTAAPNGTGGTDHGTASLAMLFGGAVAGGRVIAGGQGGGGAVHRRCPRASRCESRRRRSRSRISAASAGDGSAARGRGAPRWWHAG